MLSREPFPRCFLSIFGAGSKSNIHPGPVGRGFCLANGHVRLDDFGGPQIFPAFPACFRDVLCAVLPGGLACPPYLDDLSPIGVVMAVGEGMEMAMAVDKPFVLMGVFMNQVHPQEEV
jgi:hypothetical protein